MVPTLVLSRGGMWVAGWKLRSTIGVEATGEEE